MKRLLPHVLAVIAGGVAPGLYFGVLGVISTGTFEDLGGFLFTWGARDALLVCLLALPVLVLSRRLGLSHPALLWAISALVGIPMGYVIANPAEFAWSPSEEDFEHGMYWGSLVAYAVFFGASGLVYGIGKTERMAGEMSPNRFVNTDAQGRSAAARRLSLGAGYGQR